MTDPAIRPPVPRGKDSEPQVPGVKTKKTAKADLPAKTCAACGRPFVWRKKWRKDWDQVKYCSDACRRKR